MLCVCPLETRCLLISVLLVGVYAAVFLFLFFFSLLTILLASIFERYRGFCRIEVTGRSRAADLQTETATAGNEHSWAEGQVWRQHQQLSRRWAASVGSRIGKTLELNEDLELHSLTLKSTKGWAIAFLAVRIFIAPESLKWFLLSTPSLHWTYHPTQCGFLGLCRILLL